MKFKPSDRTVRLFVRLKLRKEMSREQWKHYQDDAEAQELVDLAVADFVASGDEPIDWATFFAELLKFIQGLMEILGPLIIPPTPTV